MAAARPVPFLSRLADALHGRTWTVAGGFLGLCALGQLLALAAYVAGGGVARARAVAAAASGGPASTVTDPFPTRPTREEIAARTPPAPTPAIAGVTVTAPAATLPPSPAPSAPGFADAPAAPTPVAAATSSVSSSDPAAPGGPNLVQPAPAPVVPGRGSAGAGAVAEFVEQAKALRVRGDTQSALARLRDAQNLVGAGESGPVIAEMALTYEQMGFADRATQQWQRLLELGAGAGAPYYLAESRLRGVGFYLAGPGGLTGDFPPASLDPAAGTGRDRGGFQQNALLRILEVKLEEDPTDPEAEKKLALRTTIKGRPGSTVDARKVRVEAQFYDLVGGTEVVPTDAETGFQWLTAPVDWANDTSEVLEATYRRLRGTDASTPATATPLFPPSARPGPIPGRSSGNGSGSRRDSRGRRPAPTPVPVMASPSPAETTVPHVYLGYMVRLYYNRQLQDVRAEPAQLLEQFRPALTLPAEPPPAPQPAP